MAITVKKPKSEYTIKGMLGATNNPLIDASGSRFVGLEIEVEGCHIIYKQDPEKKPWTTIPSCPEWYCVKDGSLRDGGAEFVSAPIPVSGVFETLYNLFKLQGSTGENWKSSIRTSIHVHVNARDFTTENLLALQAVYMYVEPALFTYVGAVREENIYCIPWYRAPNDSQKIATALQNKILPKAVNHFSQRISKYSAFNFIPLMHIGTVEFRHAPTWLSPHIIGEWAEICANIVSYAKEKVESVEEFVDRMETEPLDVLQSIHPKIPTAMYLENLHKHAIPVRVDTLLLQDTSDEAWTRLDPPFEPINRIKNKKIPQSEFDKFESVLNKLQSATKPSVPKWMVEGSISGNWVIPTTDEPEPNPPDFESWLGEDDLESEAG